MFIDSKADSLDNLLACIISTRTSIGLIPLDKGTALNIGIHSYKDLEFYCLYSFLVYMYNCKTTDSNFVNLYIFLGRKGKDSNWLI